MSKFVFSGEALHELHRMAKTLYEAFQEADRQQLAADSINEPYAQSRSLDRSLHPHDFYSYCANDKEVYLRRFHSRYTLECRGFVPKKVQRFELDDSRIELFRYCYGSTTDLQEAINLFYDVVHQLSEYHCKELF